jgi:hypothetical protein
VFVAKGVCTLVAKVSLMAKRLKRKWQIQRSKDVYISDFDALVKRWDKYIKVGGGNVEK